MFIFRCRKPVVHPDSLPARLDYAGSPQVGEMPADLRLIRLEYLDEKTDANFLIANEVDNAQPGGICQCAKEQFPIESVRFTGHSEHILTQNIFALTYVSFGTKLRNSFA